MTRRHRPPSESNKPWTTSAAHDGWHRQIRSSLLRHPHLRGGTGSHGGPDPSVPEGLDATTGTRYYMNHCEHATPNWGTSKRSKNWIPRSPVGSTDRGPSGDYSRQRAHQVRSRTRPLPFASSVS